MKSYQVFKLLSKLINDIINLINCKTSTQELLKLRPSLLRVDVIQTFLKNYDDDIIQTLHQIKDIEHNNTLLNGLSYVMSFINPIIMLTEKKQELLKTKTIAPEVLNTKKTRKFLDEFDSLLLEKLMGADCYCRKYLEEFDSKNETIFKLERINKDHNIERLLDDSACKVNELTKRVDRLIRLVEKEEAIKRLKQTSPEMLYKEKTKLFLNDSLLKTRLCETKCELKKLFMKLSIEWVGPNHL